MNKKRLLNHKERCYILEKITDHYKMSEDGYKLSEDEEFELVTSIIGKIQAPQDLEE